MPRGWTGKCGRCPSADLNPGERNDMLRRLAVASVLFTAACAGPQKQETAAKQAAPVQERLRITNQPAFDVATCHPRQLTLPQPPNQAAIIGALVSARPQVMECLVDPKNR